MSKDPKDGYKDHFGLVNYPHSDEFGKWLGYQVACVDRDSCSFEATLAIRKDHLSPAGRVHGGVVSAFLDYACGAAVFTTMKPNDFTSTVELKVNYLHPIELGDKLLAKTNVVFRGNRLCVTQGFLYRNEETEPVAMVTGTYYVVSGDKKKKS
ncbi:MAG: PaaI family thioesterase [Gammaproteobacteria bacterium]|nr:PaaI family thioesterase [Gammaproteobacteria bacterium]